MHKSAVAYAVGKLMQILGLVLLVPLGIAIYDHRAESFGDIIAQPEVTGFILAIIISVLAGSFFALLYRHGKLLQGVKEGFAVVAIGWMALTFLSSIPMTLFFIEEGMGWSNWFAHFTDAFFEIMSGFTTTGASILTDIEAIPNSLLFLRSLTHWLGGMGIITLAIVIFPAMGVSGYQMFRGEVAGPSKEKLQPRLAQTASVLWGVYVLLTLLETIFLVAAGMGLFDAICHSFATLATGGFSTKNASVAAFESPLIEWIIIVFMYIASVNFVLHFRALRGDFKSYFTNSEFKLHLGLVLFCVILFTGVLYFKGFAPEEEAQKVFRWQQMDNASFKEYYSSQLKSLDGLEPTLRTAAFQVVSIGSSTGFATADYDLWIDSLRVILVFLMFFGACAGSTSGGIKIVRILALAKLGVNELKKLAQPRLVSHVKIDGIAMGDDKISNIAGFFILFLGVFAFAGTLLTLFVPDIVTAYTATIACMSNIGPGLGAVGSVGNYSGIPVAGKWILSACMLVGRLEIFTVLILLRKKTWRK